MFCRIIDEDGYFRVFDKRVKCLKHAFLLLKLFYQNKVKRYEKTIKNKKYVYISCDGDFKMSLGYDRDGIFILEYCNSSDESMYLINQQIDRMCSKLSASDEDKGTIAWRTQCINFIKHPLHVNSYLKLRL